jgi:hypothetical protein
MRKKIKFYNIITTTAFFILLSGCTLIENKTTDNPLDACLMLKENNDWLKSTYKSYKKWGVPVSVQLSIIKYESSFRHDARPLKKNGFLWNTYYSSAYGYSQALDGTWDDYKKSTSNSSARRDSFSDSTDFIGWYINKTNKRLGIKKTDTYNLYLAYHEGINGFKRKTYKNKKWLISKAKKVNYKNKVYSKQIKKCRF